MQCIESHYNVYDLTDERSVVLIECSKHRSVDGDGLTLAFEDGIRMNALRPWPNSWHSRVVDTRSISGLSPYDNRKTAERRASCEPCLQFVRHQASGELPPGRAFISEASHATVAFVPGFLLSCIFFVYRGLNSIFLRLLLSRFRHALR